MAMSRRVIRILRRAMQQLDGEQQHAEASGERLASHVARSARIRLQRLVEKLEVLSADHGPVTERRGKAAPAELVRDSYPKFEIRQGALVRIGWSRKYGRQYVHRVSKETFRATLEALESLGNQSLGSVHPEQVVLKIRMSHEDLISAREILSPASVLPLDPFKPIYSTLNMLMEAEALAQDEEGALLIPRNVLAVTWLSLAQSA